MRVVAGLACGQPDPHRGLACIGQIDRRKATGSAGGRPPAFDATLYRLRNTVERGFNRLKQWRGIATRYDKYALTYLGGVQLNDPAGRGLPGQRRFRAIGEEDEVGNPTRVPGRSC